MALNLADDLADLERVDSLSMFDVIAVADRRLDRNITPVDDRSIVDEFPRYEQLGLCRFQEYDGPELNL